MGEFVGIAYDELFKGVARVNAGIALQPPAVGLGPVNVERTGGPPQQAGDDLGNIVGEPLGERVPKQLAGGFHHEQVVPDGDGLRVGEPRIHQHLPHFGPELPQQGVQQRFWRIHI